MSALDFWALAIWQADSYEAGGTFRTMHAIGVVRLMDWARLARKCVKGFWPPKSLQKEEEIGAYPRR